MGIFCAGCKVENFPNSTLEGLNLRVDPRRKKLVAAGPLLAA